MKINTNYVEWLVVIILLIEHWRNRGYSLNLVKSDVKFLGVDLPYFLISLYMQFLEICFMKHLKVCDPFLEIKSKNLKCLFFCYKMTI